MKCYRYQFKLIFLTYLTLAFSSCSSNLSTKNLAVVTDLNWSSISPNGGFISSIAFNPSNPNEIWLSGDDSSGLYKSTDAGLTWTQAQNTPKNQSTYSITFDLQNPNIIYAPSFFGRGLLKTSNGGQAWSLNLKGLPVGDEQKTSAMAINPNTPSHIYLATQAGIYRSTNSGGAFSKINSVTFGDDQSFSALHWSKNNEFLAGTDDGGIYVSPNGTSWQVVRTPDYTDGVSEIVSTTHALYVAFNSGKILKSTGFNYLSLNTINDPETIGFESGLWTKLSVFDGTDASDDLIYAGTVKKEENTNWGFYFSSNGGSTFQRRMNGLSNNSVFTIAVNPTNSSQVFVGTLGGGVFKTNNGGQNWANVSEGVQAWAIISFAVDSLNPSTLIYNSIETLSSTLGRYQTTNSGLNWNLSTTLSYDAFSIDIDPSNSSTILLGSFSDTSAIYRSTNGVSGPWVSVLNLNLGVQDFTRDKVNSNIIYASAVLAGDGYDFQDLGIYVSTNAGLTWADRSDFPAYHVDSHPINTGEAVAVGFGAYATQNQFQTVQSLGFLEQFPDDELTSAVFHPEDPKIIFAGTRTGKIFKTKNYDYNQANQIKWTNMNSPFRQCSVDALLFRKYEEKNILYAGCADGDFSTRPNSWVGLIRTQDLGESWETATSSIPGSSTNVIRLMADPTSSSDFYVALYGGPLYLVRQQAE